MTGDVLRMRCKACQHRWTQQLQLPMEITAFAGELTQLRCPQCDSGELVCLFGSEAQP
jgi:hypothetical protein